MNDHEQQQQPLAAQGPGGPSRGRSGGRSPGRAEIRKGSGEILLTRAKGSTKALAERLGVSRRTVERYRAGTLTTPQKRLRAALVEETESEWQPQVRAQVRAAAATSRGMMVDVTAFFGFTCKGTSDDGRERQVTTEISPTYAKQILELQEAGATEEDLHPIVRRPSRSRISPTGAPAPMAYAQISHRS
ncbi:telomere-protecting terminal protein Tpg [Streptomyces hydrogenans]|nr:terminal protein [Streptomyces hydrogenans]